MDIYYTGDAFVSEDEAKISVTDLSVIRGFGVFDFLRTYNGVPFHLHGHIARLENSARLIGLSLPCDTKKIESLVNEGLARSKHSEKSIRIVVTGGLSGDGITPGNAPQLLLMITGVKPLPASCYESGEKLITCHVERFMPGAKSINYIPAILSMRDARDRGAIEAIYIDRNGNLLEGTTSNLFAVRQNRLLTPPCQRILPGITRKVVLELANANKVEVVQRAIHKDEISLFDEVFITSSVKEVLPIIRIDAQQIGSGEVGPISRKLMQLFNAETAALR